MDRAPTTPTRPLRWQRMALALYVGVNLGLILHFLRSGELRAGPDNVDWSLWSSLDPAAGVIYGSGHALTFVWSPLAAWIMAGIVQLGYWPWFALHLGAIGLLRRPAMIGLLLVSWAFWTDVLQGNTFVFVFVAGWFALAGSRAATLVYVALLALMPRPIQFPLATWLLWRQPDARLPAIVLLLALGLATLATGYTDMWITAMLGYTDVGDAYNFGPTVWFGLVWLVVGVPLGAWLTTKGRVGLAGLAVSPYVLPQYWLAPLWDRHSRRDAPDL